MNLKDYLFDKDPYEGLDLTGHTFDPHPFSLPQSVLGLVKELSPYLIIEVGSWKGASAIHMADQLRDNMIPGHILCVDTWLGAEEMWTKGIRELDGRYSGMCLCHGYPTCYYAFLKNVLMAEHQHRITPFPTTSLIGARLLAKLDVKADMIYIDASHTYEDVIADLRSYWPLLRNRGVLIGDDYNEYWVGVRKAVEEFSAEVGAPFEVFDDTGWIIRKTPAPKVG